jgi:anti-sigma-K factor RskA
MDHAEIQSLLGAYALHAVEPEESEEVERHIEECPRCRAELEGYMRAAPLLGSAEAHAPEGLWNEIVQTIEQPSSVGTPPEVWKDAERRRYLRRRPLVAVAAASILLAGAVAALGARLAFVEGGTASTKLSQAADAALGAEGRRIVELRGRSGEPDAKVVILPGGSAYFVKSTLAGLSVGRTYQLWGLVRGKTVSLGLLGRSPSVAAFRVGNETQALMVTAEPAGGVAQPDSPVLAQARLTPS